MHIAESTTLTGEESDFNGASGETVTTGELVEKRHDREFLRAERYALMGGTSDVQPGLLFLIDTLRREFINIFKSEIKDLTEKELLQFHFIQNHPLLFPEFELILKNPRTPSSVKISHLYDLLGKVELPSGYTVPGLEQVKTGAGATVIPFIPANVGGTSPLPTGLESLETLELSQIQELFGEQLPYVQTTLEKLTPVEIKTLAYRLSFLKKLVPFLPTETFYDIAIIETDVFVGFCKQSGIQLPENFGMVSQDNIETPVEIASTPVIKTTSDYSIAALSILTIDNLLKYIGSGRIEFFNEEALRELGKKSPHKLVLISELSRDILLSLKNADMLERIFTCSEAELMALARYKVPSFNRGRHLFSFGRVGFTDEQLVSAALATSHKYSIAEIRDSIQDRSMKILANLQTTPVVYDPAIHSVPQVARTTEVLTEEKMMVMDNLSVASIEALGGANALGALSLESLKIISIIPQTSLIKIGIEIYNCARQELVTLAKLPVRITKTFIQSSDLKAFLEYKALNPKEMNFKLWKMLKWTLGLKDAQKEYIEATLYMLRNGKDVHFTSMFFDLEEGELIKMFNRFSRNKTLTRIMDFLGETIHGTFLTKGGNIRTLNAKN